MSQKRHGADDSGAGPTPIGREHRGRAGPWLRGAGAALFIVAGAGWLISTFLGVGLRHMHVGVPRASAPQGPPPADRPIDDQRTRAAILQVRWFEINVHTRRALLTRGRLLLTREIYVSADRSMDALELQWLPESGWRLETMSPAEVAWWRLSTRETVIAGAGYASSFTPGMIAGAQALHLPCWLGMAVGGAPWLVHVLPARRRARREARGLCPWCAHPRAGLPEQAVCTECGRPPPG